MRVSSKLTRQPLDTTVKFMLAMMREELGEEVASTEYDPLTKIARIEMPDSQGAVPSSRLVLRARWDAEEDRHRQRAPAGGRVPRDQEPHNPEALRRHALTGKTDRVTG